MGAPAPARPEPNDTRDLMEFLRAENEANRKAIREDAEANRKLLLDTVKFVSIPVALLIAVAGILGFKSISDLKHTLESQAHQATNAEITRMQGEIRARLEDQFKTPELQKMVRSSADAAVRSAVTQEVEKSLDTRMDDLQRRISETGEISNAGARLRLGIRSGLDTLLEKAKSPNPYVSQYAKSTLTLIGADYDTVFPQAVVANAANPPFQTPRQALTAMRSLPPQSVAFAFGAFRLMTGTKIETFDIPAAEKWCADNPKKCDEAAQVQQNQPPK